MMKQMEVVLRKNPCGGFAFILGIARAGDIAVMDMDCMNSKKENVAAFLAANALLVESIANFKCDTREYVLVPEANNVEHWFKTCTESIPAGYWAKASSVFEEEYQRRMNILAENISYDMLEQRAKHYIIYYSNVIASLNYLNQRLADFGLFICGYDRIAKDINSHIKDVKKELNNFCERKRR